MRAMVLITVTRIRFLFGHAEGKNILPISLHNHRKEPRKHYL